MNYRQLPPDPSLRNYVRYFGILENDDTVSVSQFKIIADGCPGLIFQEDTGAFLDHKQACLPRLFLHGIATKHSQKTARGIFRNVGVYFHEDGLNSIFGLDAHELTNKYISLDSICKTDLSELLLNTDSAEKRIDILASFLRSQVERSRKHQGLSGVLDEMRKSQSSSCSLKDLQISLRLSERTLERLFMKHIGISPKLFARIRRFQSSLQIMRTKKFRRLTDVALDGWYSDQSHFIREFKEFAGATPRQFLTNAREQAENFPEWID